MSFGGINKGQSIAEGSKGAGFGFQPAATDVWLCPVLLFVRSTYSRLQIAVSIGAGQFDLGIYDDSFARIIATGAAGVTGIPLSVGQRTFNPSRIWLACVTDSPGNTWSGQGLYSNFFKRQVGAGFPLPAQLNPVDFDGGGPGIIILQ